MKILRGLILAGSMTALVAGFSACGGTVCDDALDIIAGCNPADGAADGNGDGEEAECTGLAECVANCTIEHEANVCAVLKPDPANPPAADDPYIICISECPAT